MVFMSISTTKKCCSSTLTKKVLFPTAKAETGCALMYVEEAESEAKNKQTLPSQLGELPSAVLSSSERLWRRHVRVQTFTLPG